MWLCIRLSPRLQRSGSGRGRLPPAVSRSPPGLDRKRDAAFSLAATFSSSAFARAAAIDPSKRASRACARCCAVNFGECSATRQRVRPSLGKLPRNPRPRNIGLTRIVWPASVPGPFFPSLAASAMLSKKSGERSSGPERRHDKSPTARASQDSLVSSRRTNGRTGQILRSCTIDGDCRLIFKPAAISDRLTLVRPLGTSLDGAASSLISREGIWPRSAQA